MNQYGVNVGDIFCMERSGFSGHHAHFFQVLSLRGNKQIVIRELNSKEVSYGMIIPIKDSFKDDSSYIKDNKESVKYVYKRDEERVYQDSPIYITFSKFYNKGYYSFSKDREHSIYEEAYLWKGNPKRDLLEYLY